MGTAKPDDATKLRELGFDPALPPTEALAALRRLHAAGDAGVSAIAQALALILLPEAAVMLTELEHGASGGDRRAIRRALFKLRQRGIEAPHQAAVPVAT